MNTGVFSSPWFWAFVAAIGCFLGLVIVATKSIGGTLGFGILASASRRFRESCFLSPSSHNLGFRLRLGS